MGEREQEGRFCSCGGDAGLVPRLRAALTQSAAEVKKLEGAGALALALAEKAEAALTQSAEKLAAAEANRDAWQKRAERDLETANGIVQHEIGYRREAEAKVARLERTVERMRALIAEAAPLITQRANRGGQPTDKRLAAAMNAALAASSPDHAGAPPMWRCESCGEEFTTARTSHEAHSPNCGLGANCGSECPVECGPVNRVIVPSVEAGEDKT